MDAGNRAGGNKAPKVQMPRCSIIEACNASYSRSDQQIYGTYRQAVDHSNSAMEAQASGSYPAAGKQQIIVTVLWKHRLVAAIQ